MTDKDISKLDEQEFDLLLEDIIDRPPSPDMANNFKPWRKAMNRILWGVGLSTLTLNFWNLDTILPAIGLFLMFLGFRALQNENKWFKAAYITCWIRVIWWAIAFTLNLTIFSGEDPVLTFLMVGTLIMLVPGFITLVGLRNGIQGVQVKAGLPPHGGTGMMIWYLIILVLGLINFSGLAVWGLLIAYVFILRNLYKLSKELDEAGYTIVPTPIKVSDRAVALLYVGMLLISMIIGYGFCHKYPMDWQPVQASQNASVEQIRSDLLALGFPEYVLNDMTDEEILTCEGAELILVDVRDYDMDQGRGIGTQEEIDDGKKALVTDAEAARQLRTTYIGIKYADEREHWKIIHHFLWLIDEAFCGTEAMQLWPADRLDGWTVSTDITGRVLYDREDVAYASPYHSLGKVTYQNAGIAVTMFGQQTSTDVFAAFSYPENTANARGYVMYDVLEMVDGYIISAWCNYIHQRSQLQFPVQTAMEFEMTSFFYNSAAFISIQNALQLTTHGDAPALFD